MPLKTPEQYVESLRALEIRAYVGGERVDSIDGLTRRSSRWQLCAQHHHRF